MYVAAMGAIDMRRTRFGRRGFILLFGARSIVSNTAGHDQTLTCPRCGRATQMLAKSVRTWFTVFFVPVFPISGRKEFTQCAACGAQFAVSPQELQRSVSDADQQASQQAIGLYNSMRAPPANAVTLNQLMSLYASIKEYDQAISAAAEYSQALTSSEQCMATLGRVHLARGDFPHALHWLGQATARNASYGEAQYYKGVAHLLTTPPQFPQAIAAARAARTLGYAGAEELLKDAEARAHHG